MFKIIIVVAVISSIVLLCDFNLIVNLLSLLVLPSGRGKCRLSSTARGQRSGCTWMSHHCDYGSNADKRHTDAQPRAQTI